MLHIHLFHVLMEPCYSLFQPPIIILNVTVIKARDLEAKDADGNICFIGGISACVSFKFFVIVLSCLLFAFHRIEIEFPIIKAK